MFGKFFEFRLLPHQFASKLVSIVRDESVNQHYRSLLKLTDAESRRYPFTMFTFAAMLPFTMVTTSGKNSLLPFLGMTRILMLKAWEDEKNSLVRLGDFIITINEYGYLAEALGERWFQKGLSLETVMDKQIRFGTLIDKIGFIRGKLQIKKSGEIIASSPAEQSSQRLIAAYGLELETYICEDVNDSTRSREAILGRTMIFGSLAENYCKRIADAFTIF